MTTVRRVFYSCVAAGLLASMPSFGQQADGCQEKCSKAMGQCAGKCGGQTKCSESCAVKMSDCLQRCQGSKVSGAPKGKCTGADGRPIACYDPRTKPPSKENPNKPDKEQYPNKAAKDLMKDPKFKEGTGAP